MNMNEGKTIKDIPITLINMLVSDMISFWVNILRNEALGDRLVNVERLGFMGEALTWYNKPYISNALLQEFRKDLEELILDELRQIAEKRRSSIVTFVRVKSPDPMLAKVLANYSELRNFLPWDASYSIGINILENSININIKYSNIEKTKQYVISPDEQSNLPYEIKKISFGKTEYMILYNHGININAINYIVEDEGTDYLYKVSIKEPIQYSIDTDDTDMGKKMIRSHIRMENAYKVKKIREYIPKVEEIFIGILERIQFNPVKNINLFEYLLQEIINPNIILLELKAKDMINTENID